MMFLPPKSADEEWIGIVIAIPEPHVSQLTQLRLDAGDQQGARVPAHITLLPPTTIRTEDRPQVLDLLRSVAAQFSPFTIALGGAETFQPVSQVAFLNLTAGARDCCDLAEALRVGPLDIPQRFPYHPHVTLAQDVDDDALAHAVEVGDQYTASWVVPGFRLDRVDDNGIYTSMALFDFAV